MLRLRADYLCSYLTFTLGRSLSKVQDSIPTLGILSSYTQPERQITGSW